MPVPLASVRQIATLAALIGGALVLGTAREAGATGCHVAERPVFGLSTEPVEPKIPADEGPGVEDPGSTHVDRHCPSDAPDRPSPRVVVPGERPLAATGDPDPPPSFGSRGWDRGEGRPINIPPRIDRPPRSR